MTKKNPSTTAPFVHLPVILLAGSSRKAVCNPKETWIQSFAVYKAISQTKLQLNLPPSQDHIQFRNEETEAQRGKVILLCVGWLLAHG